MPPGHACRRLPPARIRRPLTHAHCLARLRRSANDASNPYSYYSFNQTWAAEVSAEFTPRVIEMAAKLDDRVRW